MDGSDERLQRLERENETLKALLLLNNIHVLFEPNKNDETMVRFQGDVEDLNILSKLRIELQELRTQYLLVRADAVVLREQLTLFMNEMRKKLG